MTQNTQTTAAWVESVLETELNLIPLMVGVDADSADIGGMDAAARIIAVRIDRLTAELLQKEQQLAEARAEIRLLKGQDDFIGDATDRQTFKAARTALERLLIRARAAKGGT